MSAVIKMEDVFRNSTLLDFTRKLIKQSLGFTRNSRMCPDMTDEEFVLIGTWRVLSQAVSGREFLQSIHDAGISSTKRSAYFETMKSERRLNMLRDVDLAFASILAQTLRGNGIDYLADFPELEGRPVLAGDGHTIEHAVHAKRDEKGRIVPVSNIHLLDLHTGIGMHLTDVQGDGSRRHEIKAFRNEVSQSQGLTHSGAQGRPIVIYDRAIIDKHFWTRQKLMKINGMDVITRKKETMKFLLKMPRVFDRSLTINKGVVEDYTVGADNSVSMRLIAYVDPEDGKEYEFLTTIDELAPGLIAWLYLLRWKIEKMFDTFKNKLQEKKAWANGATAQEIHSRFCHLARNLIVYIMHMMEHSFGITEEKLEKKREKHIQRRMEKAAERGATLHPQHLSTRYLFQLSCQFIRSVRNHFLKPKTILQLSGIFREAMTVYY